MKLDSTYTPLARSFFVAATSLSLGIAIVLLSFSEPNGDDFCRARLLPVVNTVPGWEAASGVLVYVGDSWLKWSGRWFAALIEASILTHTDLTRSYFLLILLTTLILFLGLFAIVRLVLGDTHSKRSIVTVVIAFWLLFWSRMPGPGDGFFWFTGAVENLLAPSFSLVVVAWLGSLSTRTPLRIAPLILISTLTFVVPAMHELVGLILLVVLSLGGTLVYHARRNPTAWIIVALSAGAGLLIVLLAPGNTVRVSYFPNSGNFWVGTRIAWSHLMRYAPGWLVDVPLLSATLLFVLDPRIRAIRPDWVSTYLPAAWKWLVPATSLAVVGLGFLLPSYALGTNIPLRTLDFVYLTFLLGWFTTAFVFTRSSMPNDITCSSLVAPITSGALIAFATGIILSGNTPVAIGDLRYHVGPWHSAVHARYERLKAVSGRESGTVELDRLPTFPNVFFDMDVLETVSGWRNTCLAGYFDVPAVVLRSRAEPLDRTQTDVRRQR